jgi:hypothetical protein
MCANATTHDVEKNSQPSARSIFSLSQNSIVMMRMIHSFIGSSFLDYFSAIVHHLFDLLGVHIIISIALLTPQTKLKHIL